MGIASHLDEGRAHVMGRFGHISWVCSTSGGDPQSSARASYWSERQVMPSVGARVLQKVFHWRDLRIIHDSLLSACGVPRNAAGSTTDG